MSGNTPGSRIRLKNRLMKVLLASTGTLLLATAVGPMSPAIAVAVSSQPAAVVERVATLRESLRSLDPRSPIDPTTGVQLAWWGNWGNGGWHPGWHNWPNWHNWHNWRNWHNWGNY